MVAVLYTQQHAYIHTVLSLEPIEQTEI